MTDVPVVLVHGWGGSYARTWQEPGWEDLLREGGRTVIGVDLLGHGNAPKPHDPDAYDDLTVRVTEAIVDHPVIDAIGFSLGSFTLLDLAIRTPERFRKLVVSGVGANLFRSDETDRIARAVENPNDLDADDMLAKSFAGYANWPGNDPKALAAIMRRRRRPLDPAALAALTFPVLVVLGDKDFAGPADQLMEALPNAQLVTLRGVDHFATPKDFKFIDAALAFLDAA